jgi:hypothetical protein
MKQLGINDVLDKWPVEILGQVKLAPRVNSKFGAQLRIHIL